MNGELLTLVGIILAQSGLLWYKLGRLESKVASMCSQKAINPDSTKEIDDYSTKSKETPS